MSQLNEWPYWHHFTLHFRNLSVLKKLEDDLQRRFYEYYNSPGEEPIRIKDIDDELQDVISGLYVYLPVEDRISTIGDIDEPVYMTNIRSDVEDPGDDLYILKGRYIIPTVAKYDFAKGYFEQLRRNANVDPQDMEIDTGFTGSMNMDRITKNPKYNDLVISIFLRSLRKPEVTSVKIDQKTINKIKSIAGDRHEGKAINIRTGQPVEKGRIYEVYKFSIVTDPRKPRVSDEFAIKARMPENIKQKYIERFKKIFNAEEVTYTQEDIGREEKIRKSPPTYVTREYERVFGEGFQEFMRRVQLEEEGKKEAITRGEPIEGPAEIESEEEELEED